MNRLLREGLPIAEVARRLGRSRQTIYNWMRKDPEEPTIQHRSSKLDPFKRHIESRLERFDLPATVLLREIRSQGYSGGVTILRDHVAAIKQCHVHRLVDRFETEPGRQAQVDWASCGTILHQGRRRRLSLLVVVLGYSRMIWARFVVSERRPVLMTILEDSFREFGGVPRELLFDNLKQVVAQPRAEGTPARIQPGFSSFADHWGFEVVASPPYWPRAKGKVERAISYLKSSFLEGRSFTDLDDLNAQLRVWLADVANVRLHGTTKQRPVDRLQADREAMLPVASTVPFPSTEVVKRHADHDSRISFRGVSYSVDPEIIGGRRGEPVQVQVGADERIRVFHRGRLVANHAILPPGSPPHDDPLHAAARRRRRQLPTTTRPRVKTPLFEQLAEPDLHALLSGAPTVHQRHLNAYEEAPCRPR